MRGTIPSRYAGGYDFQLWFSGLCHSPCSSPVVLPPGKTALRAGRALAKSWAVIATPLRPILVFVASWVVLSRLAFAGGGDLRHTAPLDSPEHRKYAPDRRVDLSHVALDLTPDFLRRTIGGQATLTFQPIGAPLRELKLDAVELVVTNVSASEPVAAWQVTDRQVIVTFAQAQPPGRQVQVTLGYHAQPTQGIYFRTPEMGYRPGDTHLFSQGEEIEARHWYPCLDAPNLKFTSEITCHVPAGMTVLSNGKLVAATPEAQGRLVAVHWAQDQPQTSYLVALVAGYFKGLQAQYHQVPLSFYTPPSEFAEATNSFRDTADIMGFYEQEIGVPYPWAKYAQVCVNDFVAGGMENTSLTVLTDRTLFPEATENIRSSQGLVAHEMAHQWFGDLVTCKDWSEIWLNEGFATYYAHLYDEHKNGHDAFLYGMYNDARGIFQQPNDLRSIVYREYDQPSEQFSYLAYPKGGWVLQMLRAQLGADLYRQCIRTYLDRHRYGNVVTEDLNQVIEALSGRSFDQFFDQWVYHAHYPELEVGYSWDEPAHLARLEVKQTQALSERVLLFNFPLPVRFQTRTGAVDRIIRVKEKQEEFFFALPEAPTQVRLDPELSVLAKIRFQPPPPMLARQLADTGDVMGRLLAVAALAERRDQEAVGRLRSRLNEDPFYGVRLEAAKALRTIHTDEALEALLTSTVQPDARVRREVWEALRGFYRASALAAARPALKSERNPDILAQLILTLGAYPQTETRETLLKYLDSTSFRNVLADAAIGAMRAEDDPAFIAPLLATLQRSETAFTSSGFAQGLHCLAWLAHDQDNREAVREFLVRQVNSKKEAVQLAAIRALGELGDPRAIPVVETFTGLAADRPERQAAEKALVSLREAKKPAAEWNELRGEVLDLEKTTRDLRQQLEAVKKQVQAAGTRGRATKRPPRLTTPRAGE